MDTTIWFCLAAGLVPLFVIAYVLVSLYQKVGPNQAMIVTGCVPGGVRVVLNGATVVLPLICQRHIISLETRKIKVAPAEVMTTRDGAAFTVECLAQAKVKADNESVTAAAERFLSKPEGALDEMVGDVICGHLRSAFSTVSEEELNLSRDDFERKVWDSSIADLARMGLTLEHFTIKGFWKTEGSPNASGTINKVEAGDSAVIGEAQIAR